MANSKGYLVPSNAFLVLRLEALCKLIQYWDELGVVVSVEVDVKADGALDAVKQQLADKAGDEFYNGGNVQ